MSHPLRLAALFVLAFAALPAAAPADDLAELFLPAEFSEPQISPDGTWLAYLARRGDISAVAMQNLKTKQVHYTVGDKDVVPTAFWWTAPDRVLIRTGSRKEVAIGYMASNADGSKQEELWRISGKPGLIYNASAGDPRHVLMIIRGDVVKVDLQTGEHTTVRPHIARVGRWIFDSAGLPRAGIDIDSRIGEVDIWYSGVAGGEWRSRTFTPADGVFLPAAFGADPRQLIGWEYLADHSTRVSQLDTQTGELTPLPLALPDGKEILAMHPVGRTRRPFAGSYASKGIERLVPLSADDAKTVDLLNRQFTGYRIAVVDQMPDGRQWLLRLGHSGLPGSYVLFNRETGESFILAFSHARTLSEDKLAAAEYFTFPGRHGGTLSGLLWRPKDRPRAPLVIVCPNSLPALGPRDEFDPATQALVRQGFAVLKVNVRNSWDGGAAGRSQPREAWLTGLQEDLEDAARWLAAKQVVDPTRVSLHGHGFGGVFALQVAARSRVFQAVTTVHLPSQVRRDDLTQLAAEFGQDLLVKRLGGWLESAAYAKSLSPLPLVAELGIPALYLHREEGSLKGVAVEDGRDIRKAAAKAKAPAEAVVAFTWTKGIKLPSVLAAEEAAASRRIADFLNRAAPLAAPASP